MAGNKNDAHDVRAIWKAAQQPAVKTAAIRSEAQQAVLAMHRMRQQLVKFRTAQINGLRGLLTEYGEIMPRNRAGINRGIAAALEQLVERLPAIVVETMGGQWALIVQLDREIGEIESRIKLWHRSSRASQRIAEIPGVGVLTATAVVSAMGDPAAFRSGREFAAWLGLVPRHKGTGGRVRLLGISKRGDTYLRTLLILRCPRRTQQGKGAVRMGGAPGRTATAQRGNRSAGQQDGTHHLGLFGPQPGVSGELRQPAGLGALADRNTNEHRGSPLKGCARYDKV